MSKSFYDLSAKTLKGDLFSFQDQLRGKTVLIVNVASKCGFTPQYKGLEALHQKFKDQGLVILGFPCNQFMGQEPGNAEEIQQFCSLNYDVTFPIMEKVKVNGEGTHPVYEWLKGTHQGKGSGFFMRMIGKDKDIPWNFTKYLINKEGQLIDRYAPTTTPESMEADIKKAMEA